MLLLRNLRLNFVRKYAHKTKLEMLETSISSNKISSRYDEALKKFEGRILFNSVLEIQSVRLRKYDSIIGNKERRAQRMAQSGVQPLPIVLRQLCDGATDVFDPPQEKVEVKKSKAQDLPYSRFLRVEKEVAGVEPTSAEKIPKSWLKDYELYDEAEEDVESTYGTPDPNVPVSDVPCGGCGSLLHCKEPSIPGYVPSELFTRLNKTQLTTLNCQRCHFLINYNTAINVTVKPEDYINIVSTIKEKFALAIVLVDLLDFPCSIFTGLKDLLGSKRPIFIVGNKVDLIPMDQPNYLNHIKECLRAEAMKMGFEEKHIKHISLISAKTGYGIEELITKLHNEWKYKGDVYLIGCTNVGKSSLFNALLRSDYCKVAASDIIQKATACPWPGTTLRMLKFPILKPSDYRLYVRTKRLIHQQKGKYEEEMLRRDQAKTTKHLKHATLIGHIGRTFQDEKEELEDPSAMSHGGGYTGGILTLNEKSDKYILSKWCYDTPGVIQEDQILHLLTTDEIIKTIPREMIRARAFLMKTNFSLFVGGLGRLDYIEGPESTRVVVFASLELPITICETDDADEFYETFLGSEVLGVPMDSGEERLSKWPKLEAKHDKIVVEGIEKHITACDVLLSSAGWIGINLPKDNSGVFKAWTPEKRGIYVRSPSLLPYGMELRGRRVRRSFAYLLGDAFTYKRPTK